MRKPIVAGNWKMYKSAAEAAAFIESIKPAAAEDHGREIILAPSYPALGAALEAAHGTSVRIAGQNLHWQPEGAFTGEVSADMLTAIGCTHVIVGHSERRQYFGETDGTVNLRVQAALAAGLRPIVCVGETLDQRESGNTAVVLKEQFSAGVGGLAPRQFARLILAYEPVWAIGTGLTATPETAAQAHALLRSLIADGFGPDVADSVRILYGGSVKPSNFAGLLAKPDIDGGLIGGASLDAESFSALIRA